MHPIYTSMLVKFYSCKKRVLHQFSLLCLSVVAWRPWVIDHFPSKVTYFPPSVRSRQTRHRGRSGHGSAWWPRVVRMPGCTGWHGLAKGLPVGLAHWTTVWQATVDLGHLRPKGIVPFINFHLIYFKSNLNSDLNLVQTQIESALT
jgi:hypothetical protein